MLVDDVRVWLGERAAPGVIAASLLAIAGVTVMVGGSPAGRSVLGDTCSRSP